MTPRPRHFRTRGRRVSLGVAALALAAVALAGCGSGGAAAPRTQAELVNFRLSPDFSHWLVGPISRMATAEEVREFLALEDDFAAVDFVEAFWRRRDPDPQASGNRVRTAFERRAAEADRRYDEAGLRGRRTPRGTLYVLYGPPEEVEFEIAPDGGEPIEVWRYPADAPTGLHGRAPDRFYWFRKKGDLTVPYRPGARRPRTGTGPA